MHYLTANSNEHAAWSSSSVTLGMWPLGRAGSLALGTRQSQSCAGRCPQRNPAGCWSSGSLPAALGTILLPPSLEHRAAALPCPCTGSPALTPPQSLRHGGIFPPWQFVLPQCPFFLLPWLRSHRSRREVCAHHLSQAPASLVCCGSVSGEAVTDLFLRNKKTTTQYFYTISIIYPHFYFASQSNSDYYLMRLSNSGESASRWFADCKWLLAISDLPENKATKS